MRKFKFLFLMVLTTGLLGASQFKSKKDDRHLITLQLNDVPNEMKWIQEQGWDVTGVQVSERQVDLIVNDRDIEMLERRGWLILRRVDLMREMAPDEQYKNPDEVHAMLFDLAQRFPEIAKLESLGKSLQGRDVWGLKISDHPEQRESGEPVILFNGMHHAREVMTPEIPLDIADYLLSRYATDSEAKHWVDANEIWVVPMVNPDGNAIVWSSDSMWRKNARGGHGVDINRNYPYGWNSCNGSSGNKYNQTYRGASAASEPETNILMNLVERTKPVFDISFHSYSEIVIYPEGCNGKRTTNREVVEKIGADLASLLPLDNGKGTYKAGTAWELLYSVDGGDIDWMYNVHQVIPYVIEVNSSSQGFQPSYSKWRDPTVQKIRAGWKMLLNRLDGSGIRGVVQNKSGQPVIGAQVQVTKKTPEGLWVAAAQAHQTHSDGSFHVVLNPGTYAVSVQAPAFESQNFEVVLDQAREDFNLVLDPQN